MFAKSLPPAPRSRAFLTRFVAAALLAVSAFAAPAAPVPGQGTWQTTLQARDLDGNGSTDAYYDTALDIMWLANWNANGLMTWNQSVAWAANLVIGIYDDWRLPTMTDTGSSGCNFSNAGGTDCGYNVNTATSELAHMYYVTLGNKAYCPPGDASCVGGPQAGWGLTNTADFVNMIGNVYWSGLEYAPGTLYAWFFSTYGGYQDAGSKDYALSAVAVRPGG